MITSRLDWQGGCQEWRINQETYLFFDQHILKIGLGRDCWKLRGKEEGLCFCLLWRRGLDLVGLRRLWGK